MSTSDTVLAYDRDAVAYAANGATMPASVRSDIEGFVARLDAGARVLEIGSGGGRDARLMEALGLRVRRTDITPGFVALLRVWANASLLHVARAGWRDVEIAHEPGTKNGDEWLEVSAVRV